MRGLFVASSALFVIGFSAQPAQAQFQQVKPAEGRFYCQVVFNFDLRLDIDFFGPTARMEFYNVRTGERTRRDGNFDDFRSTLTTTSYRVYPFATLEFPAAYQIQHWFRLEYRDSYGWIGF